MLYVLYCTQLNEKFSSLTFIFSSLLMCEITLGNTKHQRFQALQWRCGGRDTALVSYGGYVEVKSEHSDTVRVNIIICKVHRK